MFFRLMAHAALVTSAAFVFVSNSFAQAPIIDASVESSKSRAGAASATRPAPPAAAQGSPDIGSSQGELFYQLQLLQQEVMQLRGQVEEQAYEIQQLKSKNMERYIDLDRRIGELGQGAPVNAAQDSGRATVATGSTSAAVVTAAQVGEKEAYDRAYSLVINKQFSDALDAFKQFLVDFPNGRYAPNSYYWMGELYQVVNPADLDAAREVFTQLISQYPDHPKAPDAMYKLGRVYFMLGNKTASREWLEKVIANYASGANSSVADKARQFLNANL